MSDVCNIFDLENLKAILRSKRANIYYLEMCRVMQKDGRVVYLSEGESDFRYWNLPIANTNYLLLGTGTSITQAAMGCFRKPVYWWAFAAEAARRSFRARRWSG
jgi:CRISPR-associated endonuclease Cas1 subtype I-F